MGADSFRFKAEVDFDGKVIAKKALASQDLESVSSKVSGSTEALEQYLMEFGEHIVETLGDEIDRIESQIQAQVPAAKYVDLEAD